MTYLDYIILAIVAVFLIKGLFRGLINETIGLIGLVVSVVLAVKYMSNLAVFLKDVLDISPVIITLLSFLLVFVAAQMGVQLINYLLHKLVENSFMSGAEKLAGGALGLVKGLVVSSLLALLVSVLPLSDEIVPEKDDSVLYKPVLQLAPKMFDLMTMMAPNSKSFYSEMKESFDNFADRHVNDEAEGVLRVFQQKPDPPKEQSKK